MTLELFTLICMSGVLLTGVAIVSRMRLISLVSVFRAQSALLGLLALGIGWHENVPEVMAIGVLILVAKALVIPGVLLRIRRSVHATERLHSYLRPVPTTFLALLSIGAATSIASTVAPDADYFFAVVAFSLILFGLILLLTRTDMYGQSVGFLVMENGIYAFGLTLAHGLPFFVEIGILFDVLIVFMLIFSLIRRAHVEHASTTTDNLRELTD